MIGGDKVKAFFKSRRKTQAFAGSKLSFKDSAKKERAVPGKNDPGLAVHQATEKLLVPAIERGASRMDMVVKPDGVAAVITVDGVRSKIEAPTTEVAMQVIDNLKDLCGLDLKERRRRQNGSCWVNTADATQTMSLMVAGSSSAQQVRVDFDLSKRMGKPVQDLGLLPAQMKLVESIVSNDEPGGVVLVAAAAGQGLTTTSLANVTVTTQASVYSMHRIEGVDHQLWNPSGGVEFHTQLQSIVRRGPDVVFVDDVTDPGTGKVIASPTASDTRFYVALPVDGVGPAITEWFRAVGDVKMAAAPLRAVVAVRMIRKLCLACRVPFQPSPEQAKRLAIPAGKTVELFRAGGKVQIKSKVEDCPLCKGTGFSGQIGVFEVVILDAEAREHLAKGDLKSAYNASRLKFKAPGMQEAALMRVREGVTSLEEVVRVFTPPAAKAAAAGAKPTAKPATPPAAGGTPPKPKA